MYTNHFCQGSILILDQKKLSNERSHWKRQLNMTGSFILLKTKSCSKNMTFMNNLFQELDTIHWIWEAQKNRMKMRYLKTIMLHEIKNLSTHFTSSKRNLYLHVLFDLLLWTLSPDSNLLYHWDTWMKHRNKHYLLESRWISKLSVF